MKTPMRWAGSKKALLPVLKKYWSSATTRYIEPFCGSACLFFDIEPSAAILGDINGELIGTYRAVRNDPGRVIEAIKRLPVSRATYYKLQALKASSLSEIEAAARFLFLNRLCFNGIYRTNSNGAFNVPYSYPKRRIQFEAEPIIQMAMLLQRSQLVHGDFEVVLSEAEAGDFVYLDPPYAVKRRRVFAEYHPDSFSDDDLTRLHATLVSLHRRGVKFVLSYADSAEGRKLAKNWNARRVRTRRNVAGFAGHRKAAYEILASNLEPAQW